MNDYIDPLDFVEGPDCPLNCDGMGDFPRLSVDRASDIITCDKCGHVWSVPHQKDGEEEVVNHMHEEVWGDNFPPDGDPFCPHENAWGDCSTCDYLGDIAFDAAREARSFR